MVEKNTEKYDNFEDDIKMIIEEHIYTDPYFQTEQLLCNLTINQIMQELLKLGNYQSNFIIGSSLTNLLNEMRYNLKSYKN